MSIVLVRSIYTWYEGTDYSGFMNKPERVVSRLVVVLVPIVMSRKLVETFALTDSSVYGGRFKLRAKEVLNVGQMTNENSGGEY